MKRILLSLLMTAFSLVSATLYAQDLNGKVFVIQSNSPNANGRVIDADNTTLGKNGAKIQLWEKNGAAQQNWKFIASNKGASLDADGYTQSCTS